MTQDQQNLYSMREASRILKAASWRINYLLANGQVPEPKLRLAGRRVFTVADLQRLAESLSTVPDFGEGGDNE